MVSINSCVSVFTFALSTFELSIEESEILLSPNTNVLMLICVFNSSRIFIMKLVTPAFGAYILEL